MSALKNYYQKKLEKQIRHFVLRFVLVLWGTILIVNIVALGIIFWTVKKGWWKASEVEAEKLVTPISSPQILISEPLDSCDKVCSPNCKEYFEAALATIAAQASTAASSQTGYVIDQPQVREIGVKEYYIPLGSVTRKSFGQWSDTGMQAYVDPKNYGAGSRVYFEASLHLPTANGKVFLRLVQANENVVIADSEISGETDKPRLVSSEPLTLWSGNKLYKVQIKTSMDYEAVVDFARLRIVL